MNIKNNHLKIIKNILMLILSCILGIIINYNFTMEIVSRIVYIRQSLMDPLAIVIIVLQAVVIFSVFEMFVYKQIDKYTYKTIWTCYFLILAFVLFGRPTGFRKFNFNPLDILNGLNNFDSIFIYLLNIVTFIPIGYIFRHKTIVNMLLIMVPIEFLIETIQYIFKLGIFDINDIILNLIGICIGYILSKNKNLLRIEDKSSMNKKKDITL